MGEGGRDEHTVLFQHPLKMCIRDRVITAKNAAQLNQVVTDLLEGAVSDTTEESKDK